MMIKENQEQCLSLVERIRVACDWFHKSGTLTRRRFVFGLIHRLRVFGDLQGNDLECYDDEVDEAHGLEGHEDGESRRSLDLRLMKKIVSLLQPLLSRKDYTYARSRTHPSLREDISTTSSDRALVCNNETATRLERFMNESWYWFDSTDSDSKSTYILAILKESDSQLLFPVASYARRLVTCDQKSSNRSSLFYDEEKPSYDDDPVSALSYSGSTKYKDLITALPVYLSKYVLSLLDHRSLSSSLLVNKHWMLLVTQVREESSVQRNLTDQVMLMQGVAGQCSNALYANDTDVPVPNIKPYTHRTIKLKGRAKSATESTDCVTPALDRTSSDILLEDAGFENAYKDYSTRLVIMEQRNLYCGSYNVMVLMSSVEASQITALDTDAGSLIAYASLDRKIRFISPFTGVVSPISIHGHAGSIRCITLSEKKGIVISGSYDTSIRCWSLTSGRCIRIFRGHTDTVTCVLISGDLLASGARDTLCKVWDIETGEQKATFKHRHPVSSVALSVNICITGCDNGIVKVWSMKSHDLIKKLHAHHSVITSIKHDRWHIATAAKDGNALIWSSQGDHDKCLAALRHPKEISCLEFMYLRVLTGCIDGKIRIWNILNGQCLRIMRGNSKSDAIFRMTAMNNRITVNTSTNVLVLNFEPIEYDYTLLNDKSPSLIQYRRYVDTPIRHRPYAYVRAQRMTIAGATDTRIVQHRQDTSGHQTLHSARPLTGKSSSKVSSRPISRQLTEKEDSIDTSNKSTVRPKSNVHFRFDKAKEQEISIPPNEVKRRVSWAYENTPDKLRNAPKTKESKKNTPSMNDLKALLRSQIRIKGEKHPPDFVYLSVNKIQESLKPKPSDVWERRDNKVKYDIDNPTISQYCDHIAAVTRGDLSSRPDVQQKKRQRPQSSPSAIDARSKITPIELEMQMSARGISNDKSVMSEEKILTPRITKAEKNITKSNSNIVIDTEYGLRNSALIRPMTSPCKHSKSIYDSSIPCSIPSSSILRPVSATINNNTSDDVILNKAKKIRVNNLTTNENKQLLSDNKRILMKTTKGVNKIEVPMLMYSNDLRIKMESLKKERQEMRDLAMKSQRSDELGRVSIYNDPMRRHVTFKLYTYRQVEHQFKKIEISRLLHDRKEQKDLRKWQKCTWLAKVKESENKQLLPI